jgi:hypothetical protein
MKNYEINCVIYDKIDPGTINDNPVVEISLFTTLQAESLESAIDTLQLLYNIKEIIDIQEII